MPTRRGTTPRSLADDLRARDDDALVALLRARPDLATPPPSGSATLAARATTRISVQRALDALDTPTLQVAEALAALDTTTSRTALATACGARVDAQLETLRERALVWGPDRAVHLVRTAVDVLGPHPARLGPPMVDVLGTGSPARVAGLADDLGLPHRGDPAATLAHVAAHLADPDATAALLERAPEGASAVLRRLADDGPVGSVQDAEREVRAATATSPVGWLLAHGLIVAAGPGRVVLPREVGRGLRRGRVLTHLDVDPPPLATRAHPDRLVTGTAAGAAADAVRLVGELAELWGRSPAGVLRSGGLPVRDLKRVGDALDVDPVVAARVVELAHLSGLVAEDGAADTAFAPTPAYDAWAAGDVATRWSTLASAWLVTTRVPGLVGARDSRDAAHPALSRDLDRTAAPAVRRAVLDELAALEPGTSADAESLAARWDWRFPRRTGRLARSLVGWALAEAAWLGVTGAGALSEPGRGLIAGDVDAARAALVAALPEPVEQVLLQADLTAVAPGPLVPHVAAEMALAADVDSRGGATVYRFSPGSVRRALDAGRTAEELLSFLAEHSRTPVPQPLDYLVNDTARRHGRTRVGAAASYLRTEDPTVLGELLADPRTAVLRLRRLAPTVLASQADPTTVLDVLRDLGLAPAAEGPDGDVLVHRAGSQRTPVRRAPRPVGTDAATVDVAEAAVRVLRAADRSTEGRGGLGDGADGADGPSVPAMDPAASLALLREAAAGRARVWVGVVDPGGRARRRLVEPLGIEGGRISVYDHSVDEVRTLSVHRVVGVVAAEAL